MAAAEGAMTTNHPPDATATTLPISDEELTRWQQMADAATPGPWTVTLPPWGDGSNVTTGTGDPHGQRLICDTNEREWQGDDENVAEDAAFIAVAREAVPKLIGEVRHLRAELARRPAMPSVVLPPLGMTPARPFGVGPTCPNGCDPTGTNVVFGSSTWNCAICGARLR